MSERLSDPGALVAGGIVVADEPNLFGVTVFPVSGEVLLVMDLRPGGEISQIIVGLNAAQALRLLDGFAEYAEVLRAAAARDASAASADEEGC